MDAVNGDGTNWQQFEEGYFEVGSGPNEFRLEKQPLEEEPIAMGGLMTPVENPMFGGDTVTVKVTKAVNANQLLFEVDEKLGDRDKYQVLLAAQDWTEPFSAKNPLLLHIHPADTDVKVVNGVVKAHVPDEHWGRTDEEKKISELKERLKEGDLALPELNQILRSIIGG